MSSTHKKVIVCKFDRDSVAGFVASEQFLVGHKVELLNTAGTLIQIDLEEVKGVYFVREFADSNTLHRKTFTTRPRIAGLWVRARFRDAETLEALMPNELSQTPDLGFFLTPPDSRGNVQRIFVPRTALAELSVLAVIGASPHRRPAAPPSQTPLLFSEPPAAQN